jgi:hypothetical protein
VRKNYALGLTHVGSLYQGWGINLKDPILNDPIYWKWSMTDDDPDTGKRVLKTSAEIGAVADAVLRRHPVFEPGWGRELLSAVQESPVSDVTPVAGAPSWIYDLYLSSGDSIAADALKRNQLLAEAIPALTYPMGSRVVSVLQDRNYNLATQFADQTGHWPRGPKQGTTIPEWRHSDMREVAFLYMHAFFAEIVRLSNQ